MFHSYGKLGTIVSVAFCSSPLLMKRSLCMESKPAVAMDNILLKSNALPLFNEFTTESVTPALEQVLLEMKRDINDFEQSLSVGTLQPDYSTVIEKLEVIKHPLGFSWGMVSHLMGVKNSDELRAAHKAAQPAVVEIGQKIGQSQPLFSALKTLRAEENGHWQSLSEAQKRIITSALRRMENSGVGLELAQREQFNKLQLEAADLSTKFSNNILDSTKAFKLRLTDKSQVDGLPASALGLASQKAVANGDTESTPENGPWVLTLDMPSYLPAMQHLKDRTLRESLYRAFVTRASSGASDNSQNMRRILQIKLEMARLLGYKSYAELSLSSKMAPDVDSVLSLTEMLLEKSRPAAEKDLADLEAFAKSQTQTAGSEGNKLALWDIPYWSERLREKQYEFEEEALRPYFALPNVLAGLFSLADRIFGITIEAANGETQVWNPDVQFFNIKDSQTGEYIASFYLDPYSRPADKRGGAWMDVCVGRSKVLQRKPVAYLTCNGSPPVGDQPSLMTFREVETLFHEFGHGLQHMLTTVEHADAAGSKSLDVLFETKPN